MPPKPAGKRKGRPRGANVNRLAIGRQVNSHIGAAFRGEGRVRSNRAGEDLHLVEPGEIRQAMKLDLKQARHTALETRGTKTRQATLKQFNKDTKQDRGRACSRRRTSVRFLLPGSRDISTNILPRCYDPKGRKV